MKKYRLLIPFLFFSHCAMAQVKINPNHVYFELLGNGGLASLNYERQVLKNTRLNVHAGIGGYYDLGVYVSGILGVTYLADTKWQNRFIEFGFSMSATPSEETYYAPDDITKGRNLYMPHLGFRWYTKNQWVWRVSAMAVMGRDGTSPWAGFSVGKNF